MKPTKFASLAIVVTLVMGAISAQARPAYQFEKLNFSLTVRQQGLDYSNSAPSIYISTLEESKISSKDLLNFLADAFNTNWPAGAKLAMEYYGGDIYVVDKTGTNPVFNASAGINLGGTNVAYFRFDPVASVHAGKAVEKTPGSMRFTSYQMISFHLYRSDDADPSVYTDLNFQGLTTAKLNSSWNSVTGNTSVEDNAQVSGEGVLNDAWAELNGKVTGYGKWKGLPPRG
jgi:hypothetical protein